MAMLWRMKQSELLKKPKLTNTNTLSQAEGEYFPINRQVSTAMSRPATAMKTRTSPDTSETR